MVNAYFMDSSALIKRYVAETGTGWIQVIADPPAHNRLIIARITWVEVLSSLARRQREDSLSPEQMDRAIRSFRYDFDMQYQVVEIDRTLTETAGQLVTRHPLRAYDAIQLASALHIQPSFAHARFTSLTFLTADDRLFIAARAEGLHTDNPNHHP